MKFVSSYAAISQPVSHTQAVMLYSARSLICSAMGLATAFLLVLSCTPGSKEVQGPGVSLLI